MSHSSTSTAQPKGRSKGKVKRHKSLKPRKLPPYNVVLLDDDDHTHEYVVTMLHAIFAHPCERGFRMAQEVDRTGRVVVWTGHRELAELKRDQIHAWGADDRVATCKGSMSAIIEPAGT